MKIILDNGHGQETAGKRSPVWPDGSQLFEYEFNRDIVKQITAGLDYAEIPAEILVPELIDISLPERVRRVNELSKTEDCLLISVHANAGGGTGWEVWTSPGQTKSDEYASVFFEEATKLLDFPMRKDTSDGDMDKEARFYILTHTVCPAVLTENLFMDTRKNCIYLMSETGRKIISDLHINAIKKIYHGTK